MRKRDPRNANHAKLRATPYCFANNNFGNVSDDLPSHEPPPHHWEYRTAHHDGLTSTSGTCGIVLALCVRGLWDSLMREALVSDYGDERAKS